MTESIVLLMTRFPQAGKAKTRLIPSFGAEGACTLHVAMTEFTLQECCALDAAVHVHYAATLEEGDCALDVDKAMQDWLCVPPASCAEAFVRPVLFPQVSGDLGARMCGAMQESLAYSCAQDKAGESDVRRKKLVIIGSDCPENRRENMRHALELLDTYDCVVGPSKDGGYYLIAFSLDVPDATSSGEQTFFTLPHNITTIFQDIAWGSDSVFAKTVDKIGRARLSYTLLPSLSDVDEPADVPPKISVIIPTFNESGYIGRLLQDMPAAFRTEIIVVDAHSDDDTVALARGAVCVLSEKGRSVQMAVGASQATGDIVFFLHADSVLPPSWDSCIREALAHADVSLCYFRFAITESFWTRPFIEWATRARCILFRLPYGDQGLCVRRADFERWNLPTVPIFEDVFLVKRARQCGRLVGLGVNLSTSGRRWFQHGFVRTSIINICIHICVWLGMDLADIKEAYWCGENPLLRFVKKRFSQQKSS